MRACHLLWFVGLLGSLPAADEIPTEGEENVEMVGPALPPSLPHDATLELPEWSANDPRQSEHSEAPSNLGGGLWPAELWPLMPEPGRLSLSPRPNALSIRPPLDPTLQPLPAGLQEVYFGALSPEAIVDPQGFVDEVQQEEIGKFFEEFAQRQVNISVRMLLFGPQQQLPTDQELQALTNRWFPTAHGIVVLYPHGLPKATACCFSSSLSGQFSAEQFATVREACIKEALLGQTSGDQLARYCIKLAVRMNRLKAEHALTKTPKSAPKPRVNLKPWLLSMSLVALLGGGAYLFHRRRASELPQTWLFPDQEITPRLHAPHCGGTMALLVTK